jgi:hypothetical protein
MKKLLFLLPLMIISTCVLSQVGVKITHFRPTGDLGAILKPTIGGEVVWKSFDEEAGFIIRYGLIVSKYQARMDTFPTYAVAHSNSTTVLPGNSVIHKFNMLSFTMGFDYMVSLSEKFSFYPGLDVGLQIVDMEYESIVETYIEEGFTGSSVGIVGRLRAGTEYLILENLGLFAEVQRNLAFTVDNGGFGYNDYGIGVRYNF